MKKTKEISFLDAYKPPYYIDKGDNQVCAQDNPHHGMVMAWAWVDNTITGKRYLLNDIKKNIVRKVNGENVELPIKFNKGYSPIYVYSGETAILCVRGWGMLTGNPFRLDEDKASAIQDAFVDYIVNQLNS